MTGGERRLGPEPRLAIATSTEEETVALGRLLGACLQAGDLVCLYGGLGSGKTRLAQGIGQGCGVDEPMASPTFAFINEYEGNKPDGSTLPLMHADLYRIADEDDLASIGFDEYLDGSWVCVVEWPENAFGSLSSVRLDVRLSMPGPDDTRRLVEFVPKGRRPENVCEVLACALFEH